MQKLLLLLLVAAGVASAATPSANQVAVWKSPALLQGVGPCAIGQAVVGNGGSALPSCSASLSGVTSVNGTPIPPSTTLGSNPVILQSGFPFLFGPSSSTYNLGTDGAVQVIVGQTPIAAQTVSFDATGSGGLTARTMTFSAATLTNTSAGDVNRVLTLVDTDSVTCTSAAPMVCTGSTLSNGAPVVLGGTAVPTGFTAGVTYYAVSVSTTHFDLAAVPGGTAMTSSSTGTSVTAKVFKYATITAYSSATAATVTLSSILSGTGPFANNAIWLSGTQAATNVQGGSAVTLGIVICAGSTGQFSYTGGSGTLVQGQSIAISGTTSTPCVITSYANPTTYLVSATNGSSTFTLTTQLGGAIAQTGTTSGSTSLTFTPGQMFSALLPRALGASYTYFPANAINSGSTLGWYYTYWVGGPAAGSTVGSVFNNAYTSGQPVGIASPTAFNVTAAGAFAPSPLYPSSVIGPYASIPGNSFGANGSLQSTAFISYNMTANTGTMSPIYSGNTTFASLNSSASSVTDGAFNTVTNRGVTNSQVYIGGTTTGDFNQSVNTVNASNTIDTTQAWNAGYELRLSSSPFSFMILEKYSMLLFPAN